MYRASILEGLGGAEYDPLTNPPGDTGQPTKSDEQKCTGEDCLDECNVYWPLWGGLVFVLYTWFLPKLSTKR